MEIIIVFIVGAYFGRLLYNIRNPSLRVAEYEDGFFYIERLSDIVPFWWHRSLSIDYDGNITWYDEYTAVENEFSSIESAGQLLSRYYEKRSLKQKANKRKRVINPNKKGVDNQKRISEIIELLKGSEKEQTDILLIELEQLNK